MSNILIIDNDIHICETISSLVHRQKHECYSTHTIAEGLAQISSTDFSLVFLDISLPDGNGLSYLSEIKNSSSKPEVIILTGKGDMKGAEEAIQNGAWDFLVKPTSIEQINLSMEQALHFHNNKQDNSCFEEIIPEKIIGKSPEMLKCYDLASDAARSEANVLIDGKTGTGKELFAQFIHVHSSRCDNKFIIVDCASLSETLVESTLFGHTKGAFTGADFTKKGLITLANNGTLFLDEVGELPLLVQKHLLRVLQERTYRPVGETEEQTSNFRLITATNKNLDKMVEQGSFRQDLLYRIKTIHLNLPPLQIRDGDIIELTHYKLGLLQKQYKCPARNVSPGFYDVLNNYDWPGNVRQLFNVLERVFATLGTTDTIYARDLPPELRLSMAASDLKKSEPLPVSQSQELLSAQSIVELFISDIPTLKTFKEKNEKEYLLNLLAHHNENIAKCLEISGLSRSHFYVLLKKHAINLQ